MTGKNSAKAGFLHSLGRILRARPAVPESLADNAQLQMILRRRSSRQFTAQPIPEEVVQAILEAGRMAPSGVNLQTWTFIRFDPEDWQAKFGRMIPFKGQLAILVLSDLHRLHLLRETLDFPDEPLVLHTLAVLNAGLAAMNMTQAAEACGLASIMLSETGQTGFLDAGELLEALDLPAGVIPLTTIVFGYRRGNAPPIPPRLPLDMICGKGDYPELDRDALALWLADQQAGYKAMRPWSSFDAQLKIYQKKISQAEQDLEKAVYHKPSE